MEITRVGWRHTPPSIDLAARFLQLILNDGYSLKASDFDAIIEIQDKLKSSRLGTTKVIILSHVFTWGG